MSELKNFIVADKWWKFWSPSSGLIGGIIMGTIIAFIFIIIRTFTHLVH